MGKKLKNTGKYLLWISVSAALLYFSFRSVNWADFATALQHCRWGYVLLSMAFGALVLYIRGLRWRMQILPVDPATKRLTCWNAYNICMVVNLVLPRVGEVVRSIFVTRNSGRDAEGRHLAPIDKVLGTVIADRMWDLASFFIVFVLTLVLMWDRFGTFFTETILPGVAGKAHLWWIAVIAILLMGGFLYLCWRLRDRGRIWGRIWGYLKGMADGLSSCLHMEHGWLFVLYTALIWVLYWLMSASILWSLQGIDPTGLSPELADSLAKIDTLGMDDALLLMFAGALSSVVPVPGGFGAFHMVVAGALSSLYGIPFGMGMIFATLSHESQVIVDVFCGCGSYLYETLLHRR